MNVEHTRKKQKGCDRFSKVTSFLFFFVLEFLGGVVAIIEAGVVFAFL